MCWPTRSRRDSPAIGPAGPVWPAGLGGGHVPVPQWQAFGPYYRLAYREDGRHDRSISATAGAVVVRVRQLLARLQKRLATVAVLAADRPPGPHGAPGQQRPGDGASPSAHGLRVARPDRASRPSALILAAHHALQGVHPSSVSLPCPAPLLGGFLFGGRLLLGRRLFGGLLLGGRLRHRKRLDHQLLLGRQRRELGVRLGLIPVGHRGDVVLQRQVRARPSASPAPGWSPSGPSGTGPDRRCASGRVRTAGRARRSRPAAAPGPGRCRAC